MNRAAILLAAALLPGCVTSTVDQLLYEGAEANLGDASVAILGRRHISDYETEPEFVACVGKRIRRGDKNIAIVAEERFLDELYPWFEPRTAPLQPADIARLLQVPQVKSKLEAMKTRYLVWIDGRTVRTESAGSLTCGIAPGGAGCFGFGTWGNDSDYEAVIWHIAEGAEVGRLSARASGQSYLPAVIVPIPIIAPVRGAACDGLGKQLLEFFSVRR